MSNGDLNNYIHNINDISFIYIIINRLFQGIEYLHSNNLIHRDLNPSNILIDHDFVPFISDFEYVRDIDLDSRITCDIGAFFYSPPEQYFQNNKLDFSIDFYSFGQIIYFLFEKKNMIVYNDIDFLLKTIKSVPKMKNATNEIYDFIQNLVLENPEKRLDRIKTKFFIYEQLNKQLSLINDHYIEQYLYEYIMFNSQISSDDYYSFGLLCLKEEDYQRAKDYFEISSEKNNGNAFYYLGKLYFKGNGVLQDFHKAKFFFEKSVEHNITEAYLLLAHIYLEGGIALHDVDKAIECYKKAEPDHPMASNMIGEIYYDNRYNYRNFKKALKYFMKAAEKKVYRSYGFLGLIYYEGLEVEKDLVKAKQYFEEGANNNDPISLFQMGKLYYNGECVPKDHQKAIEYFEKSSKYKYALAYFFLGNIYRDSPYIPRDSYKAFNCYQKAVENDLAGAWTNIAYMYYLGDGCDKNIDKSIECFEKAAAKGNSVAMYNLGDIYYNGDGVKKDFIKAKNYFELSAKKDNIDSIFYLGNLYFEGKGVEQNYNKAFEIFKSNNDHPISFYYLGIMYLNGLGVDIDISKSIESFLKCSSYENYSYETYSEEEQIYSTVTQNNCYVYPALNNLGLIYLFDKENEIENAEKFIRKSGCSCFYYAKNNYGLYSQFFLNKIENAIELYKKSSDEGSFALAEYNIAYINEKKYNDMNSAIEHYKKALNFIDLPLKYQITTIEDERFCISKSFIDCFINFKLTAFYLSHSDFDSSKFYFLNALFKPLFQFLFQNKFDSLLFQFNASLQENKLTFNLKDFFLNLPLFNLSHQKNFQISNLNTRWSIFHHQNISSGRKVKTITIKCIRDENLVKVKQNEKIKDKFFDEISVPDDLIERIQCNSNLNGFISNIFKAMNSQNKFEAINDDDDDVFDSGLDNEMNAFKFKSEENEIERVLKYPKFLIEFFFQNLDDLKNDINDIINEMNEILYKPPYQILFGRLNLNNNSNA